jgi:glucosamine-6-phosphate deaminase
VLGLAAAMAVAQAIKVKLERQKWISIIFAAAPSQDEFLAALATQLDLIDSGSLLFIMDEYINLPSPAPKNFG